MLKPRVIPCLDVANGRVVKGIRFGNLRDTGDPAECARRYDAEGADELTVLDIAATPAAQRTRLDVVRRVRAVLSVPLTVGGGVREVTDAERLLEAGADKVAVNSAAVADPNLVAQLAERFGRQCVVVSIDARRAARDWEVLVASGARVGRPCALAWASEVVVRGAGEILLTSWDRDGTRDGYDNALIAAVRAEVSVPIVASGGAAHAGHAARALEAGADAVLAASVFHDGDYTVDAFKRDLARRGWETRTC